MFDKLKKDLMGKVTEEALKQVKLDQLPLDQLFNKDFMKTFTDFSTIEAFLKEGSFNVSSLKELQNIDLSILDKFVDSNSQFDNFKAMLNKALALFTQ